MSHESDECQCEFCKSCDALADRLRKRFSSPLPKADTFIQAFEQGAMEHNALGAML